MIYFWKKDQWELYDLVKDPNELRNIYSDPATSGLIFELKTELARLRKQFQDDDRFAEKQPPGEWTPNGLKTATRQLAESD